MRYQYVETTPDQRRRRLAKHQGRVLEFRNIPLPEKSWPLLKELSNKQGRSEWMILNDLIRLASGSAH